MREELPRSLVSTEGVAPIAVGVAGVLASLELVTARAASEEWPVVTLLSWLLPPVVACAYAAHAVARGRPVSAVVVTVLTAALHCSYFFVRAHGSNGASVPEPDLSSLFVAFFCTASAFSVGVALFGPHVIFAAMLGPSEDLDAGDSMLGAAGAWLVITQGVTAATLVVVHESPRALLVAILGVAIGAAALAVFGARALARRRWCTRALRGELVGWTVRAPSSSYDLTLPSLYASMRSVHAVVERLEEQGGIYRTNVVARPVATIRGLPPRASA